MSTPTPQAITGPVPSTRPVPSGTAAAPIRALELPFVTADFALRDGIWRLIQVGDGPFSNPASLYPTASTDRHTPEQEPVNSNKHGNCTRIQNSMLSVSIMDGWSKRRAPPL